jgi:hypothetical protein
MLETQIQQISTAIPSQSNGDSSKSPIQESVMSIFTVFKEKDPKPTEGSLGGVGKDKKPITAENFSPCVIGALERRPCCMLWRDGCCPLGRGGCC